ncbi:unnamed protein product [Rhodiola kirilowii]
MERAIFPNRPALPTPSLSSNPNPPRIKLNSITLPLQPHSPSSFPLDSLLHHLLNSSSPPNPKPHVIVEDKPSLLTAADDAEAEEYGSIEFMSYKGKSMLDCIVEHPVASLNGLFDLRKSELVEVDLASLLKGLESVGCWEKALLLFEWVAINLNTEKANKLDNQLIEQIVRILGKESQHTVAAKLFEKIPLEEYSLDVRAYTTILHAYARSGKYQRAISLFESLKQKNLSLTLVTYNVMLDVYGKMGRSWDKVLGLLEEMKRNGLVFDDFTCSTVITACGREGLLEEATKFFYGLKSQGYMPGTVTYNALLQVFGKAGVYSESLGILKEMEENNCSPDSVTYNELVGAYLRAGFYEEGAALIDTMTSKGILPNTVTYTTVINAYGKVGKEDKALEMFHRMKRLGCVPNVCTYNAIIGMLGKKSRSEEMIEVLREMRANGCPPNRITWNTMLAACGTTGKQTYVHRVFREMRSCGFEPDRDTFNTLISAYGRCGSGVDAAKMYEEMVKAGFTPCLTTYNALLNALARRGDWKAGELVVQDMKKKGFKLNETSYSLMLHCYAKGGNLKGLEVIEKDIYDGHIFPSWVLLRTLILVNFKCKALAGMERAFQELLRNGYKADMVVFNSMLSIYAKNRMSDRAHDMLHMIHENGLQTDIVTYNSLMDMYARSGECWKAEDILDKLHKAGAKPDLVSYNTVIKGFCRQRLMHEAIRTMSEMTARGIRPCIVTYNTFITGYAGQGMFPEINDVITYMIQHDCKPNELTYKIAVDGYCRANKHEEAMDFVSKIKEVDKSFDDRSVQRLVSLIQENMHQDSSYVDALMDVGFPGALRGSKFWFCHFLHFETVVEYGIIQIGAIAFCVYNIYGEIIYLYTHTCLSLPAHRFGTTQLTQKNPIQWIILTTYLPESIGRFKHRTEVFGSIKVRLMDGQKRDNATQANAIESLVSSTLFFFFVFLFPPRIKP